MSMDADIQGHFESIDKRFESIDKRFEKMDERFKGIDERFDSIESRMATRDDIKRLELRLELLIINMKESLEREMREGFGTFNTRLEDQAIRLDRHAALWQTGRRWSTKMDNWAERFSKALEVKDVQITELRKRVSAIEQQLNPPPTP